MVLLANEDDLLSRPSFSDGSSDSKSFCGETPPCPRTLPTPAGPGHGPECNAAMRPEAVGAKSEETCSDPNPLRKKVHEIHQNLSEASAPQNPSSQNRISSERFPWRRWEGAGSGSSPAAQLVHRQKIMTPPPRKGHPVPQFGGRIRQRITSQRRHSLYFLATPCG